MNNSTLISVGMVVIGALAIAAIFVFDGFPSLKDRVEAAKQKIVEISGKVRTPLEYYRENPVETRRAYVAAVRDCFRLSRSRNMPIRFERMQADYFMVAVRLAVRLKAKTIHDISVLKLRDRKQREALLEAFLDGRRVEELSWNQRKRLKLAFEKQHALRKNAQRCVDNGVVEIMSQNPN